MLTTPLNAHQHWALLAAALALPEQSFLPGRVLQIGDRRLQFLQLGSQAGDFCFQLLVLRLERLSGPIEPLHGLVVGRGQSDSESLQAGNSLQQRGQGVGQDALAAIA